MKTSALLVLLAAGGMTLGAQSQPKSRSSVQAVAPATGAKSGSRKAPRTMTGRVALVSPTQARILLERFKAAYPRMGSPRILLWVNRELVDDLAGLTMSSPKDKPAPPLGPAGSALISDLKSAPSRPNTAGSDGDPISGTGLDAEESNDSNITERFRLRDRNIPSLADKQTASEIERLFGRQFRLAGVDLADPRAAAEAMGSSPNQALIIQGQSDAARTNRAALKKVADVVVEILIAPRHVPLPGTNETRTYVLPDLQATAISLRDAKILSQIAATDVMGRVFAYATRPFELPEITELTALVLMESMMLRAP